LLKIKKNLNGGCTMRGRKIFKWVQFMITLTLFIFVWVFVVPREAVAQTKVQIPAGTQVILVAAQKVTPKEFKVGDKVRLTVASDVVVNGKVVIRAGAQAIAEVTESKTKGIAGQADKITISVKSVEAVDKTLVPLSGTKTVAGEEKLILAIILALLCLPLILITGGSASIDQGSQIEATVSYTVTVTVD
jgi:hypothetical protein